jgi:hypothetical protein
MAVAAEIVPTLGPLAANFREVGIFDRGTWFRLGAVGSYCQVLAKSRHSEESDDEESGGWSSDARCQEPPPRSLVGASKAPRSG